jgi:aspartyl-tRNA synthetase
VQAIALVNEKVSKSMVKFVSDITNESIIDVEGIVRRVPNKVESCTQSDVELEVTQIFVISASEARLPLLIEDAMRPEVEGEEASLACAKQDTKLDNRVIDLRTLTNQAIYRIEAGVCRLFRDTLDALNFVEIHTPKIINGIIKTDFNLFINCNFYHNHNFSV